MKAVDSKVYLALFFNREGGCGGEITRRMEKYGQAMKALYPLMKDGNVGMEV